MGACSLIFDKNANNFYLVIKKQFQKLSLYCIVKLYHLTNTFYWDILLQYKCSSTVLTNMSPLEGITTRLNNCYHSKFPITESVVVFLAAPAKPSRRRLRVVVSMHHSSDTRCPIYHDGDVCGPPRTPPFAYNDNVDRFLSGDLWAH